MANMKLTTMTRNAVSNCAEKHAGWGPGEDYSVWELGPPKPLVASIPYERMKRTPNLGKLGLADVVKWLAEDGLAMPGTPACTRRSQVSQARIEAAAELLRRHGYKVEEINRLHTSTESG